MAKIVNKTKVITGPRTRWSYANVIAETRLMFHTKLWCMAISKAVAAKKRT